MIPYHFKISPPEAFLPISKHKLLQCAGYLNIHLAVICIALLPDSFDDSVLMVK